MGDEYSYKSCPECEKSLVTQQYLDVYGRCWDCYKAEHIDIGTRIRNAL